MRSPLAFVLTLALALASGCSRSTAVATERPPAYEIDAALAAPAPPISSATATASAVPPVPTVDPAGMYLGRKLAAPMSYLGADWLDRPNRDAVQRPEHVLDVLGVRAGQTVADVGCGSGYFTVHLAKRVGPRGRVFATDLQQEMLDLLAKKVAAQKLTNVTAERTTADDAELPEGALDLALLVDVYHELPNPSRTLAQIKRALAPNGRLALVEYRGEDPKVDIKPEHKTTLIQLERELSANAWSLVATDDSLPEQRIVVSRPSK
ncbi:MAG TPA: methyltransferase domain-containing protein [Polyangiaceae bacterium]